MPEVLSLLSLQGYLSTPTNFLSKKFRLLNTTRMSSGYLYNQGIVQRKIGGRVVPSSLGVEYDNSVRRPYLHPCNTPSDHETQQRGHDQVYLCRLNKGTRGLVYTCNTGRSQQTLTGPSLIVGS